MLLVTLVASSIITPNTAYAATDYAITDVGSVHIDSITNEDGKPYNGVDADGNTVTSGVDASADSYTYILSLSGTINDIQNITSGDRIIIPINYQTGAHFGFNILAGPSTVEDHTGNTIFTIDYNDSRKQIILNRTTAAAAGTFDFTLTLSKRTDYRSYDSRDTLMATTSTLTVGNSTYTVNNTPFTNEIDDTTLGFFSSYQLRTTTTSNVTEIRVRHADAINRILSGEETNVSDKDMIYFAHVTPTQQSITKIGFNSFNARWSLAYDATHCGKYGADLITKAVTATKGTEVHDYATAAATLKPGEYSIVENADGTWDIAVNLGAEQGNDAILTPDDGSQLNWDDTTNTIVRNANQAKLSPQFLTFRFITTWADPAATASATVAYRVDRDGTLLAQRSGTITNALGTASGNLQTGIVYDANGGEGTAASQTGSTGQTITLAANGYTRNGYSFTGWNLQADGQGTSYQPGDQYTLGRTAVVMYAQWTPIRQTVLPSTGRPSDSTVIWWCGGGLTLLGVLLVGCLTVRRSLAKPRM